MDGIVRARVGYAGGTAPDPTYRTIGDHTETLQVDFDPSRLAYADLLDVFWTSHRPTSPAPSRQYASIIFAHDDEQRIAAEESRRTAEERFGRVFTDIVPLERFYLAEAYHQKYRLRNTGPLYREFRSFYRDEADFRESTAAARVNGYIDGWGTREELEAEIASFGLSPEGQALLRQMVPERTRFWQKVR